MIEAVRSLGFAARFVTGYLYDPALDGGPAGTQGAGATHAWVQVYLPGAGWVEFDPTNGIVGGRNLIRVGVARDPKQAVPLAGTSRAAERLSRHGGRGAGDADPRGRAASRRTASRSASGATWQAAQDLTGPAFSPAASRRRWQSVQKVWKTVSMRRSSVVPQALWQA